MALKPVLRVIRLVVKYMDMYHLVFAVECQLMPLFDVSHSPRSYCGDTRHQDAGDKH